MTCVKKENTDCIKCYAIGVQCSYDVEQISNGNFKQIAMLACPGLFVTEKELIEWFEHAFDEHAFMVV